MTVMAETLWGLWGMRLCVDGCVGRLAGPFAALACAPWACGSWKWAGCVCVVRRSTHAITSADTRNDTWMITCHMIACIVCWSGLMNVFSRWIDEMLISAIDSLTFSTPAFTWSSHSASSGWPSMPRRDTNVS